jgi:hypothetical protein
MPLPPLSADERRLGTFALATAVLYACAGLFFAVLPQLTLTIAASGGALPFGPAARFWQVMAVAMMAMLTLCCWLASRAPRENRRLLLPVMLSKGISTGFAAVALLTSSDAAGRRALLSIITSDLPLLLATAWFYWRAAPGVRLDVAVAPREPSAEPAKPVALGLGKPTEAAKPQA